MAIASVNRVTVNGNLTRDPEVVSLPSGSSLTKLRIAVNDRYKPSDGDWQDRVFYFDVTVWGGMGENAAKYLQKGSGVLIDGSLYWREWEAQDGTKRSAVSINAQKCVFMGGKRSGGDGASDDGSGGGMGDQSSFGSSPVPAAEDDDIPF